MTIRVLAFGIARDIFQAKEQSVHLPEGATVKDLKAQLRRDFPALDRLSSWMIAVNSNYAEDSLSLKPEDEVVLIPPVSGG